MNNPQPTNVNPPPPKMFAPLWIIASGVIIVGLVVGRLFLVPIVFAILISVVCRPIVRGLHRRLHVPPTLSAALVVLALVGVIVGASYQLAGPAERLWDHAQETVDLAEHRLHGIGEPLRKMNELKERLDNLGATTQPTTVPTTSATTGPTTAAATATPPGATPADESVAPAVRPVPTGSAPAVPAAAPASSVRDIALGIFGGISEIVSGVTEVLFLTFLLLSADGLFLRKLREGLGGSEAKHDAGSVVHEAESLILRYLIVTFAINVGQAIAVGITMKLLGVPHALLWALLTVVLEFVPYLGAAVMVVLLSVTALATFDSLGRAALVPAAYLTISMFQNNVVSPLLYGNHLKLNAVAILIGVIFFWFVWGIPGAFVAVPILAIVRIASEKSDRWRPIGSFLADDSPVALSHDQPHLAR